MNGPVEITLRQLIEVYEEKIRDLERELEKEHDVTVRRYMDYQSAMTSFTNALANIKSCKSPKHTPFADFDDKYPYTERG